MTLPLSPNPGFAALGTGNFATAYFDNFRLEYTKEKFDSNDNHKSKELKPKWINEKSETLKYKPRLRQPYRDYGQHKRKNHNQFSSL